MKWPLKKDELQQTVVQLQCFAQMFQFSMVIQNWFVHALLEFAQSIKLLTHTSELMSGTSSTVLLQLDENRHQIENVVTALERLSSAVPSDLHQRMSEISKIKTLVSELAQFNVREINNVSLGMTEVRERLQGDSSESSKRTSD
jgi:methyl-accepting chemotaxis protein